MQFFYKDEFEDQSDPANFIKTFTNDRTFTALRPEVTKNQNFFLRKGQVFQQSMWSDSSMSKLENGDLWMVASVDKYDDVGDYYLQTYIRYDQNL